MQIAKDIEIVDLALYLTKENILVLADTHIGYEEALNKQGVLIPRFQFKEIIQRLDGILKALSMKRSAGACEGLSPKHKAQGAQSPLLKNKKKEHQLLPQVNIATSKEHSLYSTFFQKEYL